MNVHKQQMNNLRHWKMDRIESGKIHREGRVSREKGRACLLTMVDRATRQTFIFKLPGQTQYSVDRALSGLERQLGAEGFRETFKTMTVDNGSECLDHETLEQSVFSRHGQPSTHPNSSWERFYPLLHSKGTSHRR